MGQAEIHQLKIKATQIQTSNENTSTDHNLDIVSQLLAHLRDISPETLTSPDFQTHLVKYLEGQSEVREPSRKRRRSY